MAPPRRGERRRLGLVSVDEEEEGVEEEGGREGGGSLQLEKTRSPKKWRGMEGNGKETTKCKYENW